MIGSTESFQLDAGERPEAIRHVITELPHDPNVQDTQALPRRLTLRPKIRRNTLRQLIDDPRSADIAQSDDRIGFIEGRLHEGT